VPNASTLPFFLVWSPEKCFAGNIDQSLRSSFIKCGRTVHHILLW
jgi:hypothetical protein